MEWLPLLYAAFVALVIIYIPGAIIARACHFTWISSFVVAPAITAFLYIALGVLFDILKIHYAGLILFLSAFCIAVCVISSSILISTISKSRIKRKVRLAGYVLQPKKCPLIEKASFIREKLPDSDREWTVLTIYVLVAFCLSCSIFLTGIETPDAFSREFDGSYHYSYIRSFVEKGTYSILNVSAYPQIDGASTFYPAFWHILSSLVMSITGLDVAVSANSVVFAALSFIFPCGVFGLLSWIFHKKYLALVVGCVCPLAFVGFPWGNLIFGQIISNFFSNALLPSTLVLFMVFVNAISRRERRMSSFVLLLFSLVSLAGTQPNAVFTSGVFFVFYVMHFASCAIDKNPRFRMKNFAKVFLCLAIFAISCVVWYVLFLIPYIDLVSQQNDFARFDTGTAIINSVTFCFSDRMAPQYFLAVITWVGFFVARFTKGYKWLCAPFLLSAILYILSASYLGPYRGILTGFWFNDVYRTGAMQCIFAIPLAALGISAVVSALLKVLSGFSKNEKFLRRSKNVLASLAILAFLPLNFNVSSHQLSIDEQNMSAFDKVVFFLHYWYSWDSEYAFTKQQYDFLKKAEEIMAQDPGIIVNMPYDGSGWMYGIDGINVLYRGWRSPVESPMDSEIIRDSLNKYAKSEEVQDAVKDLGAKYVLRMYPVDAVYGDTEIMWGLYTDPQAWKGVNAINDKTKGFEILLAEGDMRLYKIKDL